MFSECKKNVFANLDSSAVLVTGHAINLIHDEDVLAAHRLRRTYNTNREAADGSFTSRLTEC